MALTNRADAFPSVVTGSWTSAACPALQTENIGFQPSMVWVIVDYNATAPEFYIQHAGGSAVNTHLINHDTTQLLTTQPAIVITSTGFTFTAADQNANGVNVYVAFR